MKLYNVEFFNSSYAYVGSQQISDFGAEFDYLSNDENTITLLASAKVEKGNYIIISSLLKSEKYYGIVTSITEDDYEIKVKFKQLNTLLDVDVLLASDQETIEEWISEKIKETYINSGDSLQNISGLTVATTSATTGTVIDDNVVVNLFNKCVDLFKSNGIIVDFAISVQNKTIKCTVGTNTDSSKVIEADLPNVIEKNIYVRKYDDDSVNKITIYNEKDATQSATYYKDTDGNITTEPEASKRITPVVFSIKQISCETDAFEIEAQEEAESTLKDEDLNNLIELTVLEDDSLVKPYDYEYGQKANVISGGKSYNTILTAKEIKNGKIKLVFGGIRLELTKIIKRRLK